MLLVIRFIGCGVKLQQPGKRITAVDYLAMCTRRGTDMPLPNCFDGDEWLQSVYQLLEFSAGFEPEKNVVNEHRREW